MINLGKGIARHALAWLAAANLIGVLLSALLVWPTLNDALAPFTYGRWMPLHVNWQLYGWCAIPLLGLLFACFGTPDEPLSRWVWSALLSWSGMLILGGASWLWGDNSGKPFLNWAGWVRWLPSLAMAMSWVALARSAWLRAGGRSGVENMWRALALVLLAIAPFALYYATNPNVFPPINPDSGGATGTSLLGSTLAVVAIGAMLPPMLRRPRVGGKWIRRVAATCLLAELVIFALSNHSAVSHHQLTQALALGSLLVWVPLAPAYFSSFVWPSSARLWLRWSAGWWVVLILSGWINFLPGLSEETKFTHVFVAHAHLAMAGLVSSVNGAILSVLHPEFVWGRHLVWLWQGSNIAHVSILIVLGIYEASQPGNFFIGGEPFPMLLTIRLIIGVALLVPSLAWLRRVYA